MSLLKQKLFSDAQLGVLRRSGGYWKGELALLPYGTFPLVLAGNRMKPDETALNLAREVSARFPPLIAEIQRGLFEHYVPYKQAIDAGEETGSPCPNLKNPEETWHYVTPAHLLIEPVRRLWTVEIGFRIAWDVEHTVGARLQNWRFIELNGSVRSQ